MDIKLVDTEVKCKYNIKQSFSGLVFIDCCEGNDIEKVMADFKKLHEFCSGLNSKQAHSTAPPKQ